MAYGLSSFPESYDQFSTLRDLPPSKIQDAQRLQYLKSLISPTQEELAEINTLTSELQQYIISPQRWNHMSDALYGTQKFFLENTQDYIDTLQTNSQTYFNNELNKFTHKGEYNQSTQYYKRNTVTYQGETYLCLQDCINQTPVSLNNTVYWAKIAARGSQGIQGVSGIGLSFKGVWSASTTYQVNEAVQYNGQVFACMTANQGVEPNPNQNTQHWTLAIAKGSSTILATLKNTVSVTSPTTNVPIGIVEFNANTDSLIVIKNTATLAEDVNYQLNPNGVSIDSLEGIWNTSSELPITFQFIVYKNIVADLTFSDGTMIQDGTVAKSKLTSSLQSEIDSKASQNEIDLLSSQVANIKGYALKGSSSFNSVTGRVISHTIGHTNYLVDITPTQNPSGYLGEVWVEKANNSFVVKCSGTTTTSFDYIVFSD